MSCRVEEKALKDKDPSTKWIGVRLTKQTFARWAAKIIPLVGGFVSGGISWMAFSTMSKRLRVHLESLRLAKISAPSVIPHNS